MATKERLVILKKDDIGKKLNRLACQILENHTQTEHIQFIGMNERGYQLAKLLIEKIKRLDKTQKTSLFQGLSEKSVEIVNQNKLESKNAIIVVDDVLNTGRSIYFLLAHLAEIKPRQLEICVLAHRHHKQFPIHANYVGLTFATTVQEHIFFDISKPELYLE